MSDVSVLIPVEKGQEWDQARAANLPPGTPYCVSHYDAGHWAEGVNEGVKACETPLVILSAPDVWMERQPEAVEYLSELAWDCDVTYGKIVHWRDGEPKYHSGEAWFCPNRLRLENYVPPIACVRRDSFLEAGGVQSGMWDLWLRMQAQGSRFKYVPEALSARDGIYEDTSPAPLPLDLAATWYHQATPGTTYWRCQLPARHLPGQVMFAGPPMREDANGRIEWPLHRGTAVLQFTGSVESVLLIRAMKDQGIRVLAEVDDNYTRWFPQHMVKAGWRKTISEIPVPEQGYSVEGHIQAVSEVDGVICASEYLAKQYRPYNDNVFVCPNQIDPQDWAEPVKPDDGVFRIGWFASASHREDGALIEQALEWAGRQKDVEIVMVGVGQNGNGSPWYKRFPYTYRPWSNDFGVYRKFISELDVGLAPIVGTPWAVCRSDLKALETAMSGSLPIVSDQPPYADCDVPGLVRCKDSKAFLRAIQWACANRDEVRSLAREARQHVLEHRTVQANIGLWRQAVTG